jgi:hypothetical protein
MRRGKKLTGPYSRSIGSANQDTNINMKWRIKEDSTDLTLKTIEAKLGIEPTCDPYESTL